MANSQNNPLTALQWPLSFALKVTIVEKFDCVSAKNSTIIVELEWCPDSGYFTCSLYVI